MPSGCVAQVDPSPPCPPLALASQSSITYRRLPTPSPSLPPSHSFHTSQEDAARAYDLAALACKGPEAQINFSPAEYADQLRETEGYTRVSGISCTPAKEHQTQHRAVGCAALHGWGAVGDRGAQRDQSSDPQLVLTSLCSFCAVQDEVVAYVRRRSSAFR